MSADLNSLRIELREARALAFRQATDLQSLREQLAAMSVSRDELGRRMDFVSRVSHEVRSPLAAILGYVDLLLESAQDHANSSLRHEPHEGSPSSELWAGDSDTTGPVATLKVGEPTTGVAAADGPPMIPWLRVIQRNAKQLLGTLEDMVELTRLEAGCIKVDSVDTWQMREVLEVIQEKTAVARRKGLTLDMRYQGPVPERIRTDPRRFRQVLSNLVSSAIKYTDGGSVTVTLSMATSPWDESPRLALRVEDTGMGIGPEWQRHLMAAPFRAPDDAPRHAAETGLGLAVSKHIARLLGGDIEMESEPGRGSRVTWTVGTGRLDQVRMVGDLAAESTEDVPRPALARRLAAPSLDARVLVVEDGIDNQRLLRMILERAGASVELAGNGRIGVEMAMEAFRAERPYDAILMDIQMPEMDGYEATRELREQGVYQPIVALTAHAMVGDRDLCLAAGCDDYLTKPVDRELLLRTLNRWLDETRVGTGIALRA